MSRGDYLVLRNGEAARRADVPVVPFADFRRQVCGMTAHGARLAALFVAPAAGGARRLHAVLAQASAGEIRLLCADPEDTFASLTPDCPQAQGFEREIAEQWGLRPSGHPWLKPLRAQPSTPAPGGDFFRVEGAEVHEVAVGPVHAGIIEPGHFRFQCHGEEVLHLEIALGYQHRGIERALVGGPGPRTAHYMETAAGDSTVAHALAYGLALEGLADARVPARAEAVRAIGLELERLANHAGDLGALAGDIGYLPTASYCGRLRGDLLNLSAALCGNRFGRGLVRPGGVGFDLEESRAAAVREKLERTFRDLTAAVDLLWETPSVMARFEDTGTVTRDDALRLGLVGVAARASGVEADVRTDFPAGLYGFASLPPATWDTGDVLARAFVRWLEIRRSVEFVSEQLRGLPGGPLRAPVGAPGAERIVVSLVEGWRGAVCHVALTDADRRFAAYKLVDPSFANWPGLALAMRGQQISDFPLCNKSFNLSYCGHDL